MARTTVDIDDVVLRELKARQAIEGKTLGRLASELLAVALAGDGHSRARGRLSWQSRSMGPMVDIEDKELVGKILDQR